jgi:hypothetical protein
LTLFYNHIRTSTTGTNQLLDCIEIDLKNNFTGQLLTVYVDVFDNSLSRKWLAALNHLIKNKYHLEKNYCFLGFVNSSRNAQYILDQINNSINAINQAQLGYTINDHFDIDNTILEGEIGTDKPGKKLNHNKMNWLHRYFEDLQGVSGAMSPYYIQADQRTRWHIRQLNLLCHEFESYAMSYRKKIHAPDWVRPSQLMCWLNAPRFTIDSEDYELFGIETINRPLGGVFVGVNKAVGKHHWEVFHDEGRDSRIEELLSTTLSSQTEAAGDFDIEWGQDPGAYEFQQRHLAEFRSWLLSNGFDPQDKSLTIGHPQVGQVDLIRSFGTENYAKIWDCLEQHLDVYNIRTSTQQDTYSYCWSDADYANQQIEILSKGN